MRQKRRDFCRGDKKWSRQTTTAIAGRLKRQESRGFYLSSRKFERPFSLESPSYCLNNQSAFTACPLDCRTAGFVLHTERAPTYAVLRTQQLHGRALKRGLPNLNFKLYRQRQPSLKKAATPRVQHNTLILTFERNFLCKMSLTLIYHRGFK